MKIIRKLLSIQGELKLPISAGAFESALQRNTYPATSDDISGQVFKFDPEHYAQKFYGRVGGGQFQLRSVRKGNRLELANFLISGSYEPEAEGARVGYTLSLNPKATVLWLLVILAFSVQLIAIQTFVMESPGIFAFYSVTVPMYYDPADPDTVRVDNAMETWFFPSNFGLGGIALLIIAGLGYRNRTRVITK